MNSTSRGGQADGAGTLPTAPSADEVVCRIAAHADQARRHLESELIAALIGEWADLQTEALVRSIDARPGRGYLRVA